MITSHQFFYSQISCGTLYWYSRCHFDPNRTTRPAGWARHASSSALLVIGPPGQSLSVRMAGILLSRKLRREWFLLLRDDVGPRRPRESFRPRRARAVAPIIRSLHLYSLGRRPPERCGSSSKRFGGFRSAGAW